MAVSPVPRPDVPHGLQAQPGDDLSAGLLSPYPAGEAERRDNTDERIKRRVESYRGKPKPTNNERVA
jgi:hypothetical protein